MTPEEIRQFRAGTLPPEAIRRVANHIAACRDCSALPEAAAGVSRFAAALDDALRDDEHLGEDAAAYVDGQLPAAERGRIDEHLAHCVRCREDVDDLAGLARPPAALRRPRRAWWVAAVAATIAAAIAFALLLPRRPVKTTTVMIQPVPTKRATPVGRPRPEWDAAVRSALAAKAIPAPAAYLQLQQPPDLLRGTDAPDAAGVRLTAPVNEIVESVRPLFRWTAHRGARYVVTVAAEGQIAAVSPELSEPEWRPEAALSRGRTYEWEVEIRENGQTMTVPSPPAPPGRFLVLGTEAAAELTAARAAAPEDHLLLGVLCANAGLRREAEEELRQAAAAAPPVAGQLLQSVTHWPRDP